MLWCDYRALRERSGMSPDGDESTRVTPLDDLAASLRVLDGCEEELGIINALNEELREAPSLVSSATGEWNDPYLTLQITRDDGTPLRVTQGDGYTEVAAPGVEYRGYLDARSLIQVMTGALHGRASYVQHTRFGRAVRHYFETAGPEPEPLGSGQPQLGVVPLLLRLMPFPPESVQKTRL